MLHIGPRSVSINFLFGPCKERLFCLSYTGRQILGLGYQTVYFILGSAKPQIKARAAIATKRDITTATPFVFLEAFWRHYYGILVFASIF